MYSQLQKSCPLSPVTETPNIHKIENGLLIKAIIGASRYVVRLLTFLHLTFSTILYGYQGYQLGGEATGLL